MFIDEGDEGKGPVSHRHEDAFKHKFPYYLSIGMTEAQYWEGDSTLVIAYREAEEIRRERKNQELWLQGMYIYDAINRISPVLHAFAKKGTKAQPYIEEPYPLNDKDVQAVKRKQEKKQSDKGLNFMRSLASNTNKKFKEGK
jgi:hypothetical protein